MESLSVHHQESVEHQLINAGRDIEARSCDDKWELGRLASEFVTKHKLGSDQKYADQIGSQQQRVNECRRVWEERQSYRLSGNSSWTHLRVSLRWDQEDADECLKWAAENEATVSEMRVWRRARNGEDLTQPEEPVAEFTGDTAAAEPHKPIVKPEAATKAKAKAKGEFSSSPESPLNLQFALKLYCKNLRNMAADTDDAERQSTAKQLRKLADELDPPDMETTAGRCPAQKICDAVGKLTGSTFKRTAARQKALRTRWADAWWRENWEAAIERAAASDFLLGKNDRNWSIDIDFFLRPDSVAKIIEGKYDNNGAASARVRNNDFEEIPHRGFD